MNWGTFRRLAFGISPDGQQLVRHSPGKGRSEHRAGWDATFNAPKSVSVAALAGGDIRLVEAFHRACDLAFLDLERFARARAGADRNQSHDTGNLLSAHFTHYENRNLEPHLHRHQVILNITFDEEASGPDGSTAGGWRALEPRGLFAAQERATAIFRSELARSMRELGYTVLVDDKGAPQIAGVPEDLLAAFSTRRSEVEAQVAAARARAEAQGYTWTERHEAEAAERAAKATRKPKSKDIHPEKLCLSWRETCLAHGLDAIALVEAAKESLRQTLPEEREARKDESRIVVRAALDLDIEHLSERASVFSAEELETHCLLQYRYLGKYTLSEVRSELKRRVRSGELIERDARSPSNHLFTTPELIQVEKETIALVRAGIGQELALAAAHEAAQTAALPDAEGRVLNSDQERTFLHLATGTDRVTAVHGKAGAGKSFVFQRFADFARQKGALVRAFAPTLPATETLKASGLDAVTLQSHLLAAAPAAQVPEIWLLDEAGMVGARDMLDFLRMARRHGVRVILAGDTRQFASVPAGRSFGQLLESGLPSVGLEQIVRQRKAPPEVRHAVEDASEGRVREAFSRLNHSSRVLPLHDPEARYRKAAKLYTSLPGESLVVCATNEERRELNVAIRAALFEKGEVHGPELTTEVYLNKNVTQSSRTEARHYERGNVVRFAQVRHKALRPGQWYAVVGRDLLQNRVTLRGPDGQRIIYRPAAHFGIEDVFTVERRTFAAGDKLQLRGTDRKIDVKSGQVVTVLSVEGGRLVVENRACRRQELDLSRYRTLDYAYASTGHSAQSRTVDNVILMQTSNHREEVVNRASFYVGVSRTRGELFLITDDSTRVAPTLEREYLKPAALDSPTSLPWSDPVTPVSGHWFQEQGFHFSLALSA